MENKSNDATPLRPEGERQLSGLLVEMDLNKFISEIKAEKTWQDRNHNSITIYKSEDLRIVVIGMHKNAELKPHTANGNISVQVLEGDIDFCTEERNVNLKKNQMIALQAKIPHSVLAKEESFFLLTVAALHS